MAANDDLCTKVAGIYIYFNGYSGIEHQSSQALRHGQICDQAIVIRWTVKKTENNFYWYTLLVDYLLLWLFGCCFSCCKYYYNDNDDDDDGDDVNFLFLKCIQNQNLVHTDVKVQKVEAVC